MKIWDPIEERKPGFVADLGTMTDREVADKHGCHMKTVFAWRKKLGVPPFQGRPPEARIEEWHPGMAADLGKVSDREVSDKHDTSVGAVFAWRKKLGVPPCPGVGGSSPGPGSKKRGPARLTRDEYRVSANKLWGGLGRLVGTMSHNALALRAGVSPQRVCQVAARLRAP
jgi:hypothetical protein